MSDGLLEPLRFLATDIFKSYDEDNLNCCPKCTSARLRKNSRAHNYVCLSCGESFMSPAKKQYKRKISKELLPKYLKSCVCGEVA